METNELNFLETYSIEEFKEITQTKNLEVYENGGSLFFYFSKGRQGFVSKKQLPKNPVISLCENPKDEEEKRFFLMHEDQKTNQKLVATF